VNLGDNLNPEFAALDSLNPKIFVLSPWS